MSAVTVSDLRDRLQDYLRQVEEGHELSIVEGGRTIARLVPSSPDSARQSAMRRLASARGTVIVGEVVGPILGAATWTADEDHL